MLTFTVTKDAGRPKARIDWPANVAPTLDAKTTLQLAGLDASVGGDREPRRRSGPVITKVDVSASGLTPNAPVDLEWSTVVGNRVNCTGTCWASSRCRSARRPPPPTARSTSKITVPDGLGGWHVVQLIQGGAGEGAGRRTSSSAASSARASRRSTLKAGQPFTVHLKGVGWTQLDNTIAVDYDNSYVGYGCGFNSNGDVVMNLVATGGPGTHLIDMYPLLYTQQPSYANTPYGMVPVLTYARDVPGLALGYQLPAIRLAITVVK